MSLKLEIRWVHTTSAFNFKFSILCVLKYKLFATNKFLFTAENKEICFIR